MVQTPPHVFVLGDSISLHYGPALARALQPAFTYDRKRGPDGNLDHPTGANGGDSKQVLAYLRESPPRADYLLLNCGLHDIKRSPEGGPCQVGLDAYGANLENAIATARMQARHVVWARTTPVWDDIHRERIQEFRRHAADLARYNAVADEVMRSREVPSLDLYGFTLPFLPGGFSDHVHFDGAVRQAQADFLAAGLRDLHLRLNPIPPP